MKEYIVVGDYKQFKNCLIYVCGHDAENAQRAFEKAMLLPEFEAYTNIHIEEVEPGERWWDKNCD